MTDKKCEYCDKRGVPIMPLRYAIARSGGAVSPSVGAEHNIELPASAAHYTTRLLRSGYLNVYDEARDRWDFYFVTPEAYFFRLSQTPGIAPVLPSKPFDCPDLGHREVASCITIPDAKRATKVWLGFSDAMWTDTVKKLHANAAYRKRHMRCVDVKAYAASVDAKQCFGIKQLGNRVVEYAVEDRAAKESFSWSPFALNPRKERLPRLIAECDRMNKDKGFAVVLDDPVGITTELGVLMQGYFDQFVNDKARKRELAVSTAIAQIESVVREQALVTEEKAAEDLANQQLSQPDIGWLFKDYADRKAKQIESLRTVTAEEAKRAGDDAWQRYTEKFDDNARRKWQSAFDESLKTIDAKYIAPLAQVHATWMQTGDMLNYFECNHDPESAESGIVYAKTLQLCVGSTQDKGACFDLYTKWLQGDVRDKANLILGALTLNLAKTRDEIEKAASTTVDKRGLPWDSLIGNFGKATDRVAQQKADALGRVIAQLGGPIAKMLSRAVDGPVRHALLALGIVSGHPIVEVSIEGGKKAMRALLIRELTKLSGQPMNPRQIERAVSAELRRLEIRGMKLEGTEKKKFLVMVEPEQVSGMPKGMTAQENASWLAKSIRTPEQVEDLNLSRWQAKVSNPAGEIVRGSVPFIFGAVAALLQYQAYLKLSEDDEKAMTQDKTEANWRLRAGVAALGGTIVEQMGNGLVKLAAITPKLGIGLGSLGQALAFGGRLVGLGGALVMAAFDVKQGLSNIREGNTSAGIAYFASAGLGAFAALCIFVGWTGIGLILVALLLAVAVLIEYIKDNKVQEWLKRCVWGKLVGERYPTLDLEISELKVATAG